jgi:hypothetical protein
LFRSKAAAGTLNIQAAVRRIFAGARGEEAFSCPGSVRLFFEQSGLAKCQLLLKLTFCSIDPGCGSAPNASSDQ